MMTFARDNRSIAHAPIVTKGDMEIPLDGARTAPDTLSPSEALLVQMLRLLSKDTGLRDPVELSILRGAHVILKSLLELCEELTQPQEDEPEPTTPALTTGGAIVEALTSSDAGDTHPKPPARSRKKRKGAT